MYLPICMYIHNRSERGLFKSDNNNNSRQAYIHTAGAP